jgi:uncharacterized protein (TIGR02145 family)
MEGVVGIPVDSLAMWGWRGTVSQAGSKLKNTTGWAIGENGTNTSGFSALPGGYRYAEDGTFNLAGTLSYWWTSTQTTIPNTYDAWYRRLDGTQIRSYRASVQKQGGKYVRCVKD